MRRAEQRFQGTCVDRLRKTIRRETGFRVVTADRVEIFPTGAEKFDRLKADLAAARRFIHIQYFIWENDELTDALIDILRDRLKAGVEVRFLYDAVGSIAWSKKELRTLVPLGGRVAGDVTDIPKLNYRDHRKIVVIDGEVGYTGGFNVGQEYIDGGKRYACWRDTHLRLTGQIVGELEALFARRWYEKRKENVLTPEYLPAPSSDGGESGVLCQVVAQAVEEPWQSSRRAHMIAIGNAERRVWVQSPYFVPEVGLDDTLMNAALSGVDVRFMMTGVPDKKIPYWAAWTYFAPLLRAGARIYLYEAGFLHAKTIAVDSQICAIGTMNMDNRSLRLHKELMVWLFDEDVTQRAGTPLRGRHAQLPRGHPGGPRAPELRCAFQELVHAAALVFHLNQLRSPICCPPVAQEQPGGSWIREDRSGRERSEIQEARGFASRTPSIGRPVLYDARRQRPRSALADWRCLLAWRSGRAEHHGRP